MVLGVLAVGLLILGFRKFDELPTLGGGAIFAGFVILSVAVGWGAGGDCYTDWDGRSNPTVCD